MAENHDVKQGECIYSIAFEKGFFADTIWDHPNNKELREKRTYPSVLCPGDPVFVPDKQVKEVSRSTNEVHKFQVKNTPKLLRIQFKYLETPIKDSEYKLKIDAVELTGRTDGEGWLKHYISPNARIAKLRFADGSEYEIGLGLLDPVDEVRGIKQRLAALGIFHGQIDNQSTEESKTAIKVFQFANDLDPTGDADDKTRKKLEELVGK